MKKGKTFTPKQLKIDERAGKLYWSDREGMAVHRCDLDGSNIETLVVTGSPAQDAGDQSRWCVGIAVDPTRGHIYWTQKGGDNAGQGLIRRINMEMPRASSPSNRRDLITLCAGCHRRAEKLGRELGRVPRREELVALDPRRPLYEPADIAALKARYGR